MSVEIELSVLDNFCHHCGEWGWLENPVIFLMSDHEANAIGIHKDCLNLLLKEAGISLAP